MKSGETTEERENKMALVWDNHKETKGQTSISKTTVSANRVLCQNDSRYQAMTYQKIE
jgi:hypothetical protein